MKARLAAPAAGSSGPRAAGSATVSRPTSVIGNRAARKAVAGTTELLRPSLLPAAGVQLKLSIGRAPGRPGSHPARAHGGGLGAAEVHASAARGVAAPWSALPYAGLIQQSFGCHDVSSIRAHVGGAAEASAAEIGAAAYATGNHVVLGKGTDLFTVAHEAAHVIQQRGGVQLKGGVGEASDAYEQHADEVASLVVQGQSAEVLLGAHAPSPVPTSTATGPVQRTLHIGRKGQAQRIHPNAVRRQILDTDGGNDESVRTLTMMAEGRDRDYWFPTWEEAVMRTNGERREHAQDGGRGVEAGTTIDGREILSWLDNKPKSRGSNADELLEKAEQAVSDSVQPRRVMSSVRVGVISRDNRGIQEYFDRLLVSYGTRAQVVVIRSFEDVYDVDGVFIPGVSFDLPSTIGAGRSHEPPEHKRQQWNDRVALQQRVIDFARDNNLPILGVCGGSWALTERVQGGETRYLKGGDYPQHNQYFGDPWKFAHHVNLKRNSMLGRIVGGGHYRPRPGTAEAYRDAPTSLPVNSMHWASSQFRGNPAVDISASTPSEDPRRADIVEGWSLREKTHSFFVGTQWHPEFAQLGLEDFAGQGEEHQRIMNALGDAAEERRAAIRLQRWFRAHQAAKRRFIPKIQIDGAPKTNYYDYLVRRGLRPDDAPSPPRARPDGSGLSLLLSPLSLQAAKRILALDGRDGLRVYIAPGQ